MADFFTRLAETTIGVAPIVRPLIVLSFASRRSSVEKGGPELLHKDKTGHITKRTSPIPSQESVAGVSVIEPQEALPATNSSDSAKNGLRSSEIQHEPEPDELVPGAHDRLSVSAAMPEEAGAQRPGFTDSVETAAPPGPANEKPANGTVLFESWAQRMTPAVYVSGSRDAAVEQAPKSHQLDVGGISPVRKRLAEHLNPDLETEKTTSEGKLGKQAPDEETGRHSVQRPLVAPEALCPVFRAEPHSKLPQPVEPREGRRGESSEPRTVKVTIGRVDVRAVVPLQSPPTPIKSARRGPALSLDEYLEQRNRGQR